MVAILDYDLSPSAGEMRKLRLHLMYPDLLIGSGLPIHLWISKGGRPTRSQYNQWTIPQTRSGPRLGIAFRHYDPRTSVCYGFGLSLQRRNDQARALLRWILDIRSRRLHQAQKPDTSRGLE